MKFSIRSPCDQGSIIYLLWVWLQIWFYQQKCLYKSVNITTACSYTTLLLGGRGGEREGAAGIFIREGERKRERERREADDTWTRPE